MVLRIMSLSVCLVLCLFSCEMYIVKSPGAV